jgi:anti-sigma B factor antagonist
MAIEFAIEQRRLDGETQIVAVTGEVDIFTAPEFKQRVMMAIADGVELLIVDLSGTSFIDSSSLGVLIGAHRRLAARGGRLVVVCNREAIVKTFKITGLDGVFELVDSVEAARGEREPEAA